MSFTGKQNYYDLLEIAPDATPQEVRSAYLRTKAAYKKDSPALYTLIDATETEELLNLLEEAYLTLSHAEKRKEYDRSHGFIGAEIDDSDAFFGEKSGQAKIVSIDRVPPMEDSRASGDLLVAPVTDFTGAPPPRAMTTLNSDPFESSRRAPSTPTPSALAITASASALAEEIARETEWRGTTLRRIREARGVAMEELAEYTKVSKTYLYAIEEENFGKLPAPVFLRGFVIQMAKFLKLPHEKVATAYMARRNSSDTNKK